MYRLSGEYECKVDDKGRLKLPAGLVRQLGENGAHSFTINRGFERCVMLYPKRVWEVYTKALQKLNPFISKNREFIRSFYRGATPVMTDASDRIRIPKNLADHAGLKKDVIINAYAGFIEVWDRQTYVQQMGRVDSDDLAGRAEEVFGSMMEMDLDFDD